MNLSEYAFSYRPVVILVAVAAMIYGVASFFSLPAREDPEIKIREAMITTAFADMPAERVERLITKPLEEAVITLPELDEVRSTSIDGLSIIHAKVEDQYHDLDQVWDELAEAVEAARVKLPAGTSTPVVNDDFGDVAVITLALWGSDYGMHELFDLAQHARDQLITVPGTRRIEILGAREERVYLEFENAVLAELDIPPDTLYATLRNQNIVNPNGLADLGERAVLIGVSGEFKRIDDIESVLIRTPNEGSLLQLRDIATVTRGYAEPYQTGAFFNGEPAIVLAVSMQPEESVLNYSERALNTINDLQATLPAGANLDIITYQADQVANAVYGVSVSVLQTLAIVLGVVILFLGLRTGLVVGSIVPGVMLATLAVMGIFDMQLERMSLATLVIALGLLVDNGIVVAEDFKHRLQQHGNRDRALRETGGELALPLLSSSLTTVLVFLPLMLAQHPAGEYTRNISLLILISLTISWVLAMTVTPTLCHKFIKIPEQAINRKPRWQLFAAVELVYEKLLRRVLSVRIAFIAVVVVLFFLSIAAMSTVPKRFFPSSDRSQILIEVNLPAGVTTQATEAQIARITDIIDDRARYPELDNVIAYVGFGGPRFVLSLTPLDPAPNIGFMVVNATDKEAAEAAIPRLREDLRSEVSEAEVRVSGMFLGPSDPNVIQIQVKGPDADYVYTQSKQLEKILADIPGTMQLWSDWFNRSTRLNIDVDQALARNAGVSTRGVADTIAGYFSGRAVAEYRDGDEVFPIVARAVAAERENLDRLETLAVHLPGSAASVPLAQVATIETVSGFPRIQREDLTRTVTVEARNMRVSPEDMAPEVAKQLAALNASLAPGHVAEFDGIIEDSAAGKAALSANFPLALGLVAILLVAQFNSYLRPLIILLTIPLILIGAVLGLKLMQADFGFIVILGLLALAGIIVNNAIVLIDRIDIERSRGKGADLDAVIAACVRRLRPILMATITTIVGLLPLIIGEDVLFFGMASAIAFGLAVGTVLTLGVVPVLYCFFFGIKTPVTPPTNQPHSA
ncbi:efflux RND transporter permease subunit [Exilibacterium tricleocarpae]|uniref:Efflux RND transporter permease subunit n=1 Tax=Exilibacterium tricleocarpae TaxID=2591008 RepID=A0A545TAF1_9GAMM|nr:efflux RND transporter permease subunit [Exilibacterium tricleocarpae]TQV74174.1 efflux RND transporter permease subunit [Exilibacterium tricleocarpae]